jgi:beta-barrel assembly-enhancing protease
MCVAEGRSTATARKGIYALYLSAVVALSHEPAVLAQALGSKTLGANIPSEPLSQALEDFAHQTDIQVVYLSDVVADQKTRGAPAQLKPIDALVYLLEGTGLRFEFLNTRIVRVVAADVRPDDVLAEIVVTAQVRGVPKPPHFAPATAQEKRKIETANQDLERRIARSQLLYRNAGLEQYLQEVAERLLETDATDAGPVHVRIIKGTEANALTLSDGSLYVTTALIAALSDESELAAVLGHELTHYTNAHVLRGLRIENRVELASQTATALFAVAVGAVALHNHLSQVSSPIEQSVTPGPTLGLWTRASIRGYPRELESEADDGGIRRMVLAGYDASGALTALHRLAEQARGQDATPLPLYASPRRLAERIANYRQLLAGGFGNAIESGVGRRAEYRARLGELPLDQVEILLEAGALDRAEVVLAAELATGDSGRAEFLEGEIARNRIPQSDGTIERALAAYERAVTLPGAPASAYRQAGLLHRMRGESAAAVLAFQSYLARAPTAVDGALVRIYLDELNTPAPTSGATP